MMKDCTHVHIISILRLHLNVSTYFTYLKEVLYASSLFFEFFFSILWNVNFKGHFAMLCLHGLEGSFKRVRIEKRRVIICCAITLF
jgi:hypothetical protein